MTNSYDYIIVGAGSAGCVLADQLTKDGTLSVLLIESGNVDRSYLIDMPKGIAKLLGDDRFNWFYPVEPEAGNNFGKEVWIRGKTLGGSSSINGMVYNRGQPEDFEQFRQLDCHGWDWDAVLAQFRAIEDHPLGANSWRGAGGPLRLQIPSATDVVASSISQAGQALGLTRVDDMNGPHGAGVVGPIAHTIGDGTRCSAARAFLRPALQQPRNLRVFVGTNVDRLLIERGAVKGVSCSGRGAGEYHAHREVILCAGAISSPTILLRSGIGPREDLERLGIPVVADRPSVGRNMREHRVLYVKFRVKDRVHSDNERYRGLALYSSVARHFLQRRGRMSEGAFKVGLFARTSADSPRPDAQILMTPYAIDISKFPLAFETYPSITLFGFILRPESLGSISLAGSNPTLPPTIRPNYLTHDYDRKIAISMLHFIRKLAAQPALRDIIVEETEPGPDFQSDEDILRAWAQFGGCGYHTVGTCRMGADEESVVDPTLKVRGVRQLRIMDTSILPFMISGNTNAPVLAMARLAAARILEEAQAAAAPAA